MRKTVWTSLLLLSQLLGSTIGMTSWQTVQAAEAEAVLPATTEAAPPELPLTEAPAAAPVAEATTAEPATIDSLLRTLTQASLSETVDLLPTLVSVGGREILPVFEAMVAGELYYEPDTLALIRITESGTNSTATSVLTGA
ncbi:MAG: hypothetical protein V4603_15700, partial [Pseudomonadota bacterium]